ncbi:MAG TPA: TonB-dependent receptor, partial [Thermoanaerobaculia bacterium]|nr:TonB-dependent receptor [Thermoanaerobaculia bacterium]
IGKSFWLKLVGSSQESDDFTRSRVGRVEYEPLPREAIAPERDRIRARWLSARLDREIGESRLLTLEAGDMAHAGITTITESGRVQRQEVSGPWARFALGGNRWDLLGTYTRREANRELHLTTGFEDSFEESRATAEIRRTADFAHGKGRLEGGAFYSEIRVDTANPQGQQTLFREAQSAENSALFGQASYDVGGNLQAVASLRWDESNLHDDRFSPRVALVWAVHPFHTLRLSWSSAFQSPTLAEVYLDLPVAAPLDLSALEQSLAPLLHGTSLGLGSVPIVAAGNPDLGIEEIESLELGYTAILGRHAFLTLNAYRSELENFTTPLLPTSGTSLGLFAQGSFTPYRPPAGLSPEASAAVLAALAAALPPNLFAVLSLGPDGTPFIPLLSYTNFGLVETRGLEAGLNLAFDPWRLDLSCTRFEFDVREAARESPLAANAPENQIGFGIAYSQGRFDGGLRARWVDGFPWQSGVFVGQVPSYTVVDLSSNVNLKGGWRLGLDVTNLLDDEHYEIFGGDLLRRRALLHVTYDWGGKP